MFLYFCLAHLLQATAIEGEYGEIMTLTEAIPAGKIAQTWLKALEESMKTTIMINFTKCLVNTLSRPKDKSVISEFVEKGTSTHPYKIYFPYKN